MAAQDRTQQDRRHDEAEADSFPTSDPPANSGMIGPRGSHAHGRPAPHKRSDDARPKGTPTHERHAAETSHVWENEAHPPGRR